jgi:hypothetical protein
MVEKYQIAVVRDDIDFFFCVYENATEQAIDFFLFKDDADERKKFLEKGGAFDGFTPSFILKEVSLTKTPSQINRNFEEMLE